MLKILDNESDIKKAQRQFLKKFEHFIDEKILVKVGHLGASYEKEVSWASKQRIWLLSETISGRGSRYWNAFGTEKPIKSSNVSIICEINFPLSGIDRRIGGAFAKNSSGEIFVVHRGKIGGGRKGIGKSLFEDNYRGGWTSVEDGEIENTVALIGALKSPRFVSQVSRFVFEVARLKSLISSRPHQIETSPDDPEFRKEFAGKKKYKTRKDIKAECDHGLVVNDLAHVLESFGFKVGNDKNRDLYVVDSHGKIKAIFEIKNDISTTSLYSAVGQLLLNSVSLIKSPRLILTIPKKVSTTLEGKLNKLGIELLIFGWRGDKAVFPRLDSLNI
jgi:hypothetical protein